MGRGMIVNEDKNISKIRIELSHDNVGISAELVCSDNYISKDNIRRCFIESSLIQKEIASLIEHDIQPDRFEIKIIISKYGEDITYITHDLNNYRVTLLSDNASGISLHVDNIFQDVLDMI